MQKGKAMFKWSITYLCALVGLRTQSGTACSRRSALAIVMAWLRSLPPNGVRIVAAGVWPDGKDN